jgi:nucleotide-binding universal stress UspA family protein
MIEKILVAVDGSAESVKAVSFACELAAKDDVEIVLLHVLLRGHMAEGLRKAVEVEVGTRSQRGSGHLVNMPQEIMARVTDKKTIQLSLEQLDVIGKYVLAQVGELCHEKGVRRVTKRVEEGNPAKVILDVAESTGADIIVMGGRGLGDLKGILLGSVSQKVTQLSKCTCVTVK